MAGKLEVEAKYQIADRDTFSRFLSEEQMGRFKLTLQLPTRQKTFIKIRPTTTSIRPATHAGYAERAERGLHASRNRAKPRT